MSENKTPLEQLTVEGFKSIQSLQDFKLTNLNVLIGGNGAGKSNFIELFRMISSMMRVGGLKEFIQSNADAYLFGGIKQTPKIHIKMLFGQNGYEFELAPTEDGFFLINAEKRHYLQRNTTKDLGNGHFDPQLLKDKDLEGYNYSHNASWYTYNAICNWQPYHFHDTSILAGMRRYQDVGHNEKLFFDASNIAPFLFYLNQQHIECYRNIIETIRLVIPFFDDFILRPNQQEQIRLNWRQKGLNDYPMRPSQLSDGAMRFICLTTALLQPNSPSTIIIDEPELGLHPYAIGILAELFQAASEKMQVIISTQSPALVDYFDAKDVIIVNRLHGASEFKRLNPDELTHWLEDYSLGELWHKNIISGHPSHELY
ncbi:MAG: AAA family ATPase [Thiotrichaceae bacterium]|nr:AAA family ATPase [Thiotrichaceae bacterium]